jgi:hypothetical protein
MTLGGAEDLLRADERHRLGDDGTPSIEIEAADPQRGQLPEPHARIGEHEA